MVPLIASIGIISLWLNLKKGVLFGAFTWFFALVLSNAVLLTCENEQLEPKMFDKLE